MSDVIAGPIWAARNWSADEGAGSIHDDDTANELGFRGGTVAGDVHMNQFPPVLIKALGQQWFERGNLSLSFKNATVDRERVQAFAEVSAEDEKTARVWMTRDDGLLVATGSATLGNHAESELRKKDYRSCEPSELRILNRVEPGVSLGTYQVMTDPKKQFQRYDAGLISDPLPWFRTDSPWGGPVAAPCTVIEFLWGYAMIGLKPLIGEGVGLFGAIEIGFDQGPLMMNAHYRLESRVICVGQSPQTEYVWYETEAFDQQDRRVAMMLMQSRVMKDSSALYPDL